MVELVLDDARLEAFRLDAELLAFGRGRLDDDRGGPLHLDDHAGRAEGEAPFVVGDPLLAAFDDARVDQRPNGSSSPAW